IDELSTWYVRRSRERFKGDDAADKQAAIATLRKVLLTLAKVMAPFTPFLAERIYLTVEDDQLIANSVHLEDWPVADTNLIDEKVLNDMVLARKVVEMGLSIRKESGLRVRQPLGQLSVVNCPLTVDLQQIIADELNVQTVSAGAAVGDDWRVKEDGGITVALNIVITEDLKKEGLVREIVRTINQARKDQGLTRHDRIIVAYHTADVLLNDVFQEFSREVMAQVLATELHSGGSEQGVIDGRQIMLSVLKQ
ncbi:MAG: class I tRNA ligase family protein, partial [Candidatus Magasanikbacteria bacterium]|nr:class I tRNA ligase family protein [Candidatus Magasanikbacteria bacterium]